MALALTTDRKVPYTLERERDLPPEVVRTIWYIRPLSAQVMARVCDARGLSQAGSSALLCLLGGLTGWKDLRDAQGRPVRHEDGLNGDAVSLECLDRIPQEDRYELARAIYELSELPPKKNEKST